MRKGAGPVCHCAKGHRGQLGRRPATATDEQDGLAQLLVSPLEPQAHLSLSSFTCKMGIL